jgi:hypothetical protein
VQELRARWRGLGVQRNDEGTQQGEREQQAELHGERFDVLATIPAPHRVR